MTIKPLLIAIPGFLGSAQDFEGLKSTSLTSHFDWHVIDLWKDSHFATATTFRDWQEQFHTYIKQLKIPSQRLVYGLGYSLGGRLLLHTLSNEKWSGAILISTHPGLMTESEKKSRRLQDNLWIEKAVNLSWSSFLQEWNQQSVLQNTQSFRSSPIARERVFQGLSGWSLSEQQDFRLSVHEMKIPLLWLTGARDQKFTNLASEISKTHRQSTHCLLEEAGHRVFLDQPDKTAQTILKWVAKNRT